jgi:hypothetical protein
LPVLVHGGAECLPLDREVAHPARFTAPLLRDQVRVLAFGAAGRGWLGGAQWLDLAVRVAAVSAAMARQRDPAVA